MVQCVMGFVCTHMCVSQFWDEGVSTLLAPTTPGEISSKSPALRKKRRRGPLLHVICVHDHHLLSFLALLQSRSVTPASTFTRWASSLRDVFGWNTRRRKCFIFKALFLGADKALFWESFLWYARKKVRRQKQSFSLLFKGERERNDNNEFPPHKMQMSKKSQKRDDYLESALERAALSDGHLFSEDSSWCYNNLAELENFDPMWKKKKMLLHQSGLFQTSSSHDKNSHIRMWTVQGWKCWLENYTLSQHWVCTPC